MSWQETMKVKGWDRTRIAIENEVTKPRVTQIMSLLKLPLHTKQLLLSKDETVATLSIKAAIRLVANLP